MKKGGGRGGGRRKGGGREEERRKGGGGGGGAGEGRGKWGGGGCEVWGAGWGCHWSEDSQRCFSMRCDPGIRVTTNRRKFPGHNIQPLWFDRLGLGEGRGED